MTLEGTERIMNIVKNIPDENEDQVHDILVTFLESGPVTKDEGLIAFQQMRQQIQDAGVPEMTLDEINAEIAEVRKERHSREG